MHPTCPYRFIYVRILSHDKYCIDKSSFRYSLWYFMEFCKLSILLHRNGTNMCITTLPCISFPLHYRDVKKQSWSFERRVSPFSTVEKMRQQQTLWNTSSQVIALSLTRWRQFLVSRTTKRFSSSPASVP